MKLNLPNQLTMFRVFIIPVFAVLLILANAFDMGFLRILSAVLFSLACITDFFDGAIARRCDEITNFGKLMDPLADKMLVVTAIVILAANKEVHYLSTLIVVLREIAVSSIRLVALEKGIVIAASPYGKVKTATQMISLVMILFNVAKINGFWFVVTYILFYASIAIVIISLVDYIVKNIDVFTEE